MTTSPVSTRAELTARILAAKRRKGLSWKAIAERFGRSPEWTTAALLGQMALDAEQARLAVELFDLPEEAPALLQEVPYKGALPALPPSDPLIYRLYEIVLVYGTTIKALIHEEFGDGIMSAIDFDMKIERQSDPKGDRVRITMSGKFLPYKAY
ncbi:MAG: cyanate hydratase [Gammaproteobacteria bacterium]|nr:MAG: cyanate hydratase [Gammaproteobacteria bacterium]